MSDTHFWKNIFNRMLHGVNQKNTLSQNVPVSVRVQPELLDIMEQIKELAPKNWFKDGGELKRACLSVGVEVMFVLLEKETNLSSSQRARLQILRSVNSNMNVIARNLRREALSKEAGKHRHQILESELLDRVTLAATVAKLDAIRDEVLAD